MTPAPIARTTRVLPLDAIDAPELDARIDRDPERLEELARDILRRGLIEPIKVVEKGDRFEVVDGERRRLAHKSAGLREIECFVYPTKELAQEGIKYAANIFREDMSIADEAVMMRELYTTECGEDIERLAALAGKSIGYCSDRLNLLAGDELVFEALRNRDIKLGVAQALNEIPAADYRRYYLQHAIKGGATVSTVRGWVMEWKAMYQTDRPAPPVAPAANGPIVSQPIDIHFCYVCKKSDPRFIPEQIAVHTHCKLASLDPMLAAFNGGSGHSE